ncbi:MAG: uncharacterized protein A8A55_2044 [Amphiamblys sp. WSBS2006]|nr:MAG: uncharacterized protein A8A55_2044 [Amphiamblys sp. WSBS2006]
MDKKECIGEAAKALHVFLSKHGGRKGWYAKSSDLVYTGLLTIPGELGRDKRTEVCEDLFGGLVLATKDNGAVETNRVLLQVFSEYPWLERSFFSKVSIDVFLETRRLCEAARPRSAAVLLGQIFRQKEQKTREVITEKLGELYEQDNEVLRENVLFTVCWIVDEVYFGGKRLGTKTFLGLKWFAISGITHANDVVAVCSAVCVARLCCMSEDHLLVRSIVEDLHVALSREMVFGHVVTLGAVIGSVFFSRDSLLQKRSFNLLLSLFGRGERDASISLELSVSSPDDAYKAICCLSQSRLSREHGRLFLYCVKTVCPLFFEKNDGLWQSIRVISNNIWDSRDRAKTAFLVDAAAIIGDVYAAICSDREKETLRRTVEAVLDSGQGAGEELLRTPIPDRLGIDIFSEKKRRRAFFEVLRKDFASGRDASGMVQRVQYVFSDSREEAPDVFAELEGVFADRGCFGWCTARSLSAFRELFRRVFVFLRGGLTASYEASRTNVEEVLRIGSQFLGRGRMGDRLSLDVLGEFMCVFEKTPDVFIREPFVMQFEEPTKQILSELSRFVPEERLLRVSFLHSKLFGKTSATEHLHVGAEEAACLAEAHARDIGCGCPRNESSSGYEGRLGRYSGQLLFCMAHMTAETSSLFLPQCVYFLLGGDAFVLRALHGVMVDDVPCREIVFEFAGSLSAFVRRPEHVRLAMDALVICAKWEASIEALHVAFQCRDITKIPYSQLMRGDIADITLVLSHIAQTIRDGRCFGALSSLEYLAELKRVFGYWRGHEGLFIGFLKSIDGKSTQGKNILSTFLLVALMENSCVICYAAFQEMLLGAFSDSGLDMNRRVALVKAVLLVLERPNEKAVRDTATAFAGVHVFCYPVPDRKYAAMLRHWAQKMQRVPEAAPLIGLIRECSPE